VNSSSRPPLDLPVDQIITSWLPSAFQAAAQPPPAGGPMVRLTLSGQDGGEWDLHASEASLVVTTRDPRSRRGPQDSNPDIWLRQSVPDFLTLFRDDPDLPALLPPDTGMMDVLYVDERRATLLAQIDGRLRFEIEGRRRRRWAIDVAFGPSGMRAGHPRSTVHVDSRTCEELARGGMAPLQALLAGRLKIEGDRALVMQVVMLVGSIRRDS
jgi:hypothetical protein